MADGASLPTGRIRREDADQVLIGAMICVATSRIDTPDMEHALYLIEQALPLSSKSSRIEALREAASGILLAAPRRRKPGGANAWCLAHWDLSRAIAADAIRVAKSKVGYW